MRWEGKEEMGVFECWYRPETQTVNILGVRAGETYYRDGHLTSFSAVVFTSIVLVTPMRCN